MHKRTKECAIDPKVKKKVEERDDHCCIFCGKSGRGEAHVIPRSQGGLGIEQNLVTACRECHRLMDNTALRPIYLSIAKGYLKNIYQGWSEDDVIYRKGEKTKAQGSWINKNLVNNGDSYIENMKKPEKTKDEKIVFFEDYIEGIDKK